MSVPINVCLNCGMSKEFVNSHRARMDGYFCATVDYFGETDYEWPRHRFADWPKRWLRQLGIREEALGKYARVESLNRWAIDCADSIAGHVPLEGECTICCAPVHEPVDIAPPGV